MDAKYPACARSSTDADGCLRAARLTNGSGRVMYAAARFGSSSCAMYRTILPYAVHENLDLRILLYAYAGLCSDSGLVYPVIIASNAPLPAAAAPVSTAVGISWNGRTNGVKCILISSAKSENVFLAWRALYWSYSSDSFCIWSPIIIMCASFAWLLLIMHSSSSAFSSASLAYSFRRWT